MKKKVEKIERPVIRPQPGYQEKVLSSPADILISGAAAGVGKTFALIMETTRYIHIPSFGARGFRRTTPQIRNQGGLWDTSREIYPSCGGKPRESELEWIFPSGAKVKFSHLEHEKNTMDHQGAQYPLILFDELTHFTKKQFLYLLSRNRSACGIRPYIRATCNPDPDSWVRDLVDPWIGADGFPIKEMEGKILYLVVDAGNFVFGETPEELIEKCPHVFSLIPDSIDKRDIIKSITFISGTIYENKKLLEADPSYLGNLLSQAEEDRKTLLEGNWNVRVDGLSIFKHSAIQDVFTNKIERDEENRYITVDVARQGVDLAVIKVWYGWEVVEIHIYTKCRTTEITDTIEKLRSKHNIPKRQVAVDQDGVGGGVMDEGQDEESGYYGFSGGAPALEDPKTKIKERYANLKTQCAFRIGERVNESKVAISEDVVIFVDYEETDIVTTSKNGEPMTYRKLLSQDLRSFKRSGNDDEGKKKMIAKSEQKNILGRSPDCGDTFIMREVFELIVEEEEPTPGFYIF